jgi:hypothetical protein
MRKRGRRRRRSTRRMRETVPLGLKSKSMQFQKGKLKGQLGDKVEIGDKQRRLGTFVIFFPHSIH